jgi:YVTN family beta-propeller protein
MNRTINRLGRLLLVAALFSASVCQAVHAPIANDTYISGDGGDRNKNFGDKPKLEVSADSTSLLRLNLSGLPAGTVGVDIARANLLLWVDDVKTAGVVSVVQALSAWNELTVTFNTAPAFSASPNVNVSVTAGTRYVLVDITPLVRQWVDTPSSNYGVAVRVASSAPGTRVNFVSADADDAIGASAMLDITLNGPAGPAGAIGAPGPMGATGATGATGPAGAAGSVGPVGSAGPAGIAGPAGMSGAVGPVGPAGPMGATGATGAIGPAGPVGATGPQGLAGTDGVAGAIGATGAQGVQGIQGDTGPVGPTGPTGATGPAGAPGSGNSDPVLTRTLVANYDNTLGTTVSVIDQSSNTVIATIPVKLGAYALASSALTRRAYVGSIGSNEISIIDIAGATAFQVPVGAVSAGATQVTGVAVNPAGNRLYVSRWDTGTVHVLDTATNSQVAAVSVGGNPYNVAFLPSGQRAYVSNPNGQYVTVIDTTTNTVITTFSAGAEPYGVAVNPAGTRLYVGAIASAQVSVFNTANNSLIATIAVGSGPLHIAINPAGTFAYVANGNSGTVSVIDLSNNTVTTTISGFNLPAGVAFNLSGDRAYISNRGGNNVAVIDTATHTILTTVPVGNVPLAVTAVR